MRVRRGCVGRQSCCRAAGCTAAPLCTLDDERSSAPAVSASGARVLVTSLRSDTHRSLRAAACARRSQGCMAHQAPAAPSTQGRAGSGAYHQPQQGVPCRPAAAHQLASCAARLDGAPRRRSLLAGPKVLPGPARSARHQLQPDGVGGARGCLLSAGAGGGAAAMQAMRRAPPLRAKQQPDGTAALTAPSMSTPSAGWNRTSHSDSQVSSSACWSRAEWGRRAAGGWRGGHACQVR